MKTRTRILVLLGVTLLLSTLVVSAAPAQSPDPPEVLENGEPALNLDLLPQALEERRLSTVIAGDNSINVVTTWWSTSGTVFTPASSTTTYEYGYPGCVDTGTSGDIWRGVVNLPHGSTITAMWFNYANEISDPSDTTIYLRRYKFNGDFDDILYVVGSATGIGNHTHWTGTVANNVVDNFNYSYVLVWIGNASQNLCGANLGYTPPPIYLQALPMIEK